MDERERRPSDLLDEANWTPIAEGDEAWSPPRTFPPPLDAPAPPLLNTHQMGWEAFEQLILAMARRLDGAYDARRYGTQGQSQDGADVVAFFPDRPPSVYSARRRRVFRPQELEQTVEEYLGGRRPFGTNRVVVAVASEARDTAVINKLHELREKHGDARIELWDQGEISERLRSQPRLVSTFFGPATAEAFCGSAPRPAPEQAIGIASDAILRGPVAHLGLGEELDRARSALEDRPDEATEILAGVADRLTETGFSPHAAAIRSLQAKALRAANRRAQEAAVRLDLGWFFLNTGEPLLALEEARQVTEWEEAPEAVDRRVDSLAAAARFRLEHALTLDDVAEAVDALPQDDPHRADAALLLAEEAIAARRADIVEKRASELRELADGMPQTERGLLVAARLRMCVADAIGDWAEVAASAAELYPPPTTALILARHARHLTLEPNPAAAVARWRDAIERACVERLNDDASDWLYALRATKVQTGKLTGDLNELHRHAQALRAAGSGQLLPEPYAARERALASMRDGRWPDAYTALRRHLWSSTVRASWAEEVEAHERFGDLFAATGRVKEAIEHYVFAGHRKKLEELAAALPDNTLRLPIGLRTPRPWERAAAFTFAAAAADLLADEDAKAWCSAALEEVIEHPQPAAIGAPDPWLAAFKAFGALADVSSEEEARRFLDFAGGLVPRRPNSYRFTDEDHVVALIGIADAHAGLREEGLAQLVALLLTDQRMAQIALRNGSHLLHEAGEDTRRRLEDAATEGNLYAALAVIEAGGGTDSVTELARERLEASLAPRSPEAGVMTYGTALPETAVLVSVLPEEDRLRFARGMVEFAKDRRETGHNRADALVALQAIARLLPGKQRDDLFEGALTFAQGEYAPSTDEAELPSLDDPLQRFRFSFPGQGLEPVGLVAAAALARPPEQTARVQGAAVALLPQADERASNAIARALASIPPDDVTLDIEFVAAHPVASLRALAAVLWTQAVSNPNELGLRLARDPSPLVRRSLATSLRNEDRAGPGPPAEGPTAIDKE